MHNCTTVENAAGARVSKFGSLEGSAMPLLRAALHKKSHLITELHSVLKALNALTSTTQHYLIWFGCLSFPNIMLKCDSPRWRWGLVGEATEHRTDLTEHTCSLWSHTRGAVQLYRMSAWPRMTHSESVWVQTAALTPNSGHFSNDRMDI
ncbi:hypothetical protein AAY473_001374 [Plecturocebus cupreus]